MCHHVSPLLCGLLGKVFLRRPAPRLHYANFVSGLTKPFAITQGDGNYTAPQALSNGYEVHLSIVDPEVTRWRFQPDLLCFGLRHRVENAHTPHFILQRAAATGAIRSRLVLSFDYMMNDLDAAVRPIGDFGPSLCDPL